MTGVNEASVELAGDAAESVGEFTYTVAGDLWEWSDSIYSIHGFEPGAVVPTTELMASHKHPEDVSRWLETMMSCLRTGRPFSCYYRIFDAARHVRNVVAVGDVTRDDTGHILGFHGYLIDLTEATRAAVAFEAKQAVSRVRENSAVIEQAKGVLMFTYGLDPDAAFVILSWHSQCLNIKVRDLARRLVEHVQSARFETAESREHMNEVLSGLS